MNIPHLMPDNPYTSLWEPVVLAITGEIVLIILVVTFPLWFCASVIVWIAESECIIAARERRARENV